MEYDKQRRVGLQLKPTGPNRELGRLADVDYDQQVQALQKARKKKIDAKLEFDGYKKIKWSRIIWNTPKLACYSR